MISRLNAVAYVGFFYYYYLLRRQPREDVYECSIYDAHGRDDTTQRKKTITLVRWKLKYLRFYFFLYTG